MTQSILDTIKTMLGIPLDQTAFDWELIVHINSVLMTCFQLGVVNVGSTSPLYISNNTTTWYDMLGEENGDRLNLVKSYVYLKVKMIFDPPTVGATVTSFEKQIQEFEVRLMIEADPPLPDPIPPEEP